jgi:hypothetical protein
MSTESWNRGKEFRVRGSSQGSWRRCSVHYELSQLIREELLTINKIHCPRNHLNAMADCTVNLLLHGLDLLAQPVSTRCSFLFGSDYCLWASRVE